MASIKSLRQRGDWEIGFVNYEAPTMTSAKRVLYIWDRDGQGMRAFGEPTNNQQARDLLRRAAQSPLLKLGARRPKRVFCRPRDADDVRRFAKILGATLKTDTFSDGAKAIQRAYDAALNPRFAGEPPSSGSLWRQTLADLGGDSLSAFLDISIVFRMTGIPGIDEVVVQVGIGADAECCIDVFSSDEAWRTYRGMTEGTEDECVNNGVVARFFHEDMLGDEEFETLSELDLLNDEVGPLILTVEDGVARPMSSSEEARLLAVCTCLANGRQTSPETLFGIPGQWSTVTPLGVITTRGERARHSTFLTVPKPPIALTLAQTPSALNRIQLTLPASDVEAVTLLLSDCTDLGLSPRGAFVEVRAWNQESRIEHIMGYFQPDLDLAEVWLDAERAEIAIVSDEEETPEAWVTTATVRAIRLTTYLRSTLDPRLDD